MTPENKKNKRLVGLFLLGCVLFNFPFLSLFSLQKTVFGIPLLFFYVFAVWAVLILLMAAATKTPPYSSTETSDRTES